MTQLINFIWQSTFCLAFFYGLYWVFLKNEKTFLLNRVYLLVTPLLAMVFPIVKIPVPFDKPNISLENTAFIRAIQTEDANEVIGTFGLPEITVTGSKLPLLWEVKDYLMFGYLVVVVMLLCKLVWQYFQLRQILEKGWYQTKYILSDNYFKVPTFGMAPVFSFFDKIFWDENEQLSDNEKKQIIQHELEHVKQKHSYDVLYYQFLSIIFWFNPMIHLMRYALIDLHEYQADARVLAETTCKESYPRLLVKMAFKGIDLPIGNYFIRSTTLKRIVMMKKPYSINRFKLIMLLPLMIMLFGLVSMKTNKGIRLLNQFKTQPTAFLKNQILAAQDSIQVGIRVKNVKNPLHYESIGVLENEQLVAQLGELSYEFTGIRNEKDYHRVVQLIESLRSNSTLIKKYENVLLFDEVEKRPEPLTGWGSWHDYLQQQIPRHGGHLPFVSGPVVLEFIIDQEGKITHPSIKKSLNVNIDQKLLAALQNQDAPRWQSGRDNGNPAAVLVHTHLYISNPESSITVPDQSAIADTKADSNPSVNDDESQTIAISESPRSLMYPDSSDLKTGAINLGIAAKTHLAKNLVYPFGDRNEAHIGTVLVQLTANQSGAVTDYQIVESVSPETEAILLEVMEDLPALEPVIAQSEYQILLPVIFQLRGSGAALPPSQKEKFGEEITVNGYVSTGKRRIRPELPPLKPKIPLKIINDKYINFNGMTLPLTEGLSKGIASMIRYHDWDPEKMEVELFASNDLKMGTIQDVQNALKENGLNRIHYAKPAQEEPTELRVEPLYVLDGVVQNGKEFLEHTRPADIESISVMKNNQINLYGERAKNGVVIITTKK
ncbi:BlaR1 peptidase M56 [Cyclobacterium lianum]|uniref:BlaR1 peptidase M56 n=1 Tax=Cyclobacterium lianum TaxID=388280 RepID=A0A1M7LBG6_9BACT|nr:M56 family metallopeptidase [Cyclobacterium lianum]SHM75176.1 BlaR1 peptidase M56 [Cyclobacterium lianum]